MAHIPESELFKKLNDAKKLVKIGSKYFHYKNPDQFYIVLNLAIDENTESVSVVYQALYGKKIIFTRPISNWLTPGKFMLKSKQCKKI